MKLIKLLLITLFISSSSSILSQNKEVINLTITVKDENNKAIPGASILFDNKKQARRTNKKGVFKIKLKSRPLQIAAFSVMHGIKAIKYNGEKNLTILIRPGENKSEIISSNKKEVVAGAKQFLTIYDYIRGKVPGVSVNGNNSIRIRGISNFGGGSNPLFVLNGTQVDATTFGDIVPTTIKTVKVLKGPDAAIYGLRGANGVIEVKTAL
ncbi:TonB-dependent receptor plug domain-containing protein [Polaribacter sp.]|uniref:TonB-dependent receptor plug domain-containing protein n=1 Tax=Polaribacter sp. TaxID=1920175 RepID=UPI003F6BA750